MNFVLLPVIKSRNPREILNEIKWRALDLRECEVIYLHRGAPNDRKSVRGDEIEKIEGGFMVIGETMIPLHRILEIKFKGETIFRRRS